MRKNLSAIFITVTSFIAAISATIAVVRMEINHKIIEANKVKIDILLKDSNRVIKRVDALEREQ